MVKKVITIDDLVAYAADQYLGCYINQYQTSEIGKKLYSMTNYSYQSFIEYFDIDNADVMNYLRTNEVV